MAAEMLATKLHARLFKSRIAFPIQHLDACFYEGEDGLPPYWVNERALDFVGEAVDFWNIESSESGEAHTVFENSATFLHALLPKEKAREFEVKVASAVFSSEEVLEELRKTRWYSRREKQIAELRGVAPNDRPTLLLKTLMAKLRSSRSKRVRVIREAAELAFSNQVFHGSYEEPVRKELHKLCEETVANWIERRKEYRESVSRDSFWKKFAGPLKPPVFKIEINNPSKNFKELLNSRRYEPSTVLVTFHLSE